MLVSVTHKNTAIWGGGRGYHEPTIVFVRFKMKLEWCVRNVKGQTFI